MSGSDVGGLVAGVVALLECPHVASPLVADKLVTLLLTMLGSSERQRGQFASAAASRALKLAVLGMPPTPPPPSFPPPETPPPAGLQLWQVRLHSRCGTCRRAATGVCQSARTACHHACCLRCGQRGSLPRHCWPREPREVGHGSHGAPGLVQGRVRRSSTCCRR